MRVLWAIASASWSACLNGLPTLACAWSALEDGDLGLADSVRDGGCGVLEALDEAELWLEHVARLVGDGDVEAGEVDADACARVLAVGEGLTGDLAPRSGLEGADVAVVGLAVDAVLEGFGRVCAGRLDTIPFS